MAKYLGTIKGSRGEASRLGSAQSGMVAKINGWNHGLRIEVDNRLQEGERRDIFHVVLTGGSNEARQNETILTIEELPKGGFKLTMPADGSGRANFLRTIEK